MVTPTAMNMYLPAMAEMQRDFATSAAAIQLTLSLFLIATAAGQLVVGPLSDMIGRRPTLLWGLAIYVVATVACALAPTIEMLVAARVVQALGGCAGLVLARAIIRDMHETSAAASMIGYVTMGMAVGPMITPPIGGVIADAASWRLIFWLLAALGAAAVVLTLTRLVETRPPEHSGPVLKRWASELAALLRIGDFWLFASTLAALCIAFFSFIAGGIFVATEVYGLTASQYGLFFVMNVVGYVLGSFLTGRFSGRIGIGPMIVGGNAMALCAVAAAVALTLGGPSHPLHLFGPMFFLGIGNGLALPNCVAGAVSVRPQLAGSASGLAGAFQIGAGAIASLMVGLIVDLPFWDGTSWPILAPMLAGTIIAFALSLRLIAKMSR
jgi:DHA1 family bicyclomycin/chloramphenicol resistance-like MFS transporter